MEDLQDFVNTTTSSNEELRPLVDNAEKHAKKLAQQAQRLKEYIFISFSNTLDAALLNGKMQRRYN